MEDQAPPAERRRPFLLTGEGWPYLLVPLIPVAIVLELMHAGAVPVLAASALGVIPTAALMGRATEELAARSGPAIGGLLNVTFGNAPELIIALFALPDCRRWSKPRSSGRFSAIFCWSSGCRCWRAVCDGSGSASSCGQPPLSHSCCCLRPWPW